MNRSIIDKNTMQSVYKDYLEVINHGWQGWEQFTIFINSKYQLNFSSSAYRKRITLHQQSLEWIAMDDNQDIREKYLNIKEIKLESKKKHIQSLNKEFNELKKDYLKNNELEELVSTFVAPSIEEIKKIEIKENDSSNIFVIADEQCIADGMTKKIYEFVYNQIINVVEKENLSEIYLLQNGDIIEGLLRISDLANTKGGYVAQLTEVQEALSILLERLSKKVKVKFSIVTSNHTNLRTLNTNAGSITAEDVTFLIFSYLYAYLKDNPNIEWLNKNVDSALKLDHNIINIQGYNVFHHHSHWYGASIKNIQNLFDKVSRFYEYNIDLMILSHWHHLRVEHIIQNKKKLGDKLVIFTPALDPRINKPNENSLLLSSSPSFIRIKLEKEYGVKIIETFNLPKKLWKY